MRRWWVGQPPLVKEEGFEICVGNGVMGFVCIYRTRKHWIEFSMCSVFTKDSFPISKRMNI